MLFKKVIYYLNLLLFLFSFTFVNGQEYKIDHLNQNAGLINPFINAIEQTNEGLLMIGTGEGVGVYDGNEVKMYFTRDGLVENYVSKIYKDKRGDVWIGHKNGGGSIYYNGNFDIVFPGDGVNSVIVSIQEDNKGLIWFTSQSGGLYQVDEKGKIKFYIDQFKEMLIYSSFISDENEFLIGTDRGLEIFKYYEDDQILSKSQSVPGLPQDQVVEIKKMNKDQYLIATLNSGFFIVSKKDIHYSVTPVKKVNYSEEFIVRSFEYDGDVLYISTLQEGLVKTKFHENSIEILDRYNASNGLKTNSANVSFLDRESVLWIGTYGEGLAHKNDNKFVFYFRKHSIGDLNEVFSIKLNKNYIYIAGRGKFEIYEKQNLLNKWSFDQNNGLPNDIINNITFAPDSTLYVGTDKSGVYFFNSKDSVFKKLDFSQDQLANAITNLKFQDYFLWIGTLNGLYRYSLASTGIVNFDMSTGLPHNVVGGLYVDEKENIVATKSAFFSKYEEGAYNNYPLNKDFQIVNPVMISKASDGMLWLATTDNGIYEISDTAVKNFTTYNGIESDYCYSIIEDDKHFIWVSHDGGLSKFDPKTEAFTTYGAKSGVDVRFLPASVDQFEDQLWFGTENGVVVYNANEDKVNLIPPLTSITSIKINDEVQKDEKLFDLPYGEYNLSIEIKGVSLKNSKGITFQYMLEGYDQDWSFHESGKSIKYNKLSDGNYVFKVRSINSDGIVGNTVSFDLNIAVPIWKKWWFYILLFIVLSASTWYFIRRREHQLIKYQKELERQLALRTKEVVEQKEEIEEINKDLTDSINYAKRIQRSILPEEELFSNRFDEHFIFYNPKDIVSGDFYWIKDINNKTVVVCGDCTGHGVPGGFMSMISLMLIYETTQLKGILDPGLILKDLNTNIVNVLKQNDDFGSNKDGMDVSICVIDWDNMKMQVAGAMRPTYIYREQMQHVIKGDRFSIGGTLVKDKFFETNEFELKTGDVIYMFSDGYPDQFGGENKRKLKITGFNELLDQVSHLPLKQQKKEISDFYFQWKGDNFQMDDVLVMGIKI